CIDRHGPRNAYRPSLHTLIVESVIGRSHLGRHVGTQPFDLPQSRLPSIRMWTVSGDRLDLFPRDLSGEHKIKLFSAKDQKDGGIEIEAAKGTESARAPR